MHYWFCCMAMYLCGVEGLSVVCYKPGSPISLPFQQKGKQQALLYQRGALPDKTTEAGIALSPIPISCLEMCIGVCVTAACSLDCLCCWPAKLPWGEVVVVKQAE